MNNNPDNLNETLKNLFDDGGREFLLELDAARRAFDDNPVTGPDEHVLSNIKALVAARCRSQKRTAAVLRAGKIAACAACILALALLWLNFNHQPNPAPTSSQVWSSDSAQTSGLENQLASIGDWDNSVHVLIFEDTGSSTVDDMQTELNEISTSFWEG